MRKFGPKILQLLTEWTETFPSDFREEKMVGQLKDIIHRIAPCDEVRFCGHTVISLLLLCSERITLIVPKKIYLRIIFSRCSKVKLSAGIQVEVNSNKEEDFIILLASLMSNGASSFPP